MTPLVGHIITAKHGTGIGALERAVELEGRLTDDGDVAQLLVPGNVLEHLEALGDGQIYLRKDDVRL
jgi:hypothetical protein